MDRREFIKTTSSVIAGATLASQTLAANAATPPGSSGSGRLLFPINRNWRFSPKVVSGGHDKSFDDSVFERVVIPHTNVRLSCGIL